MILQLFYLLALFAQNSNTYLGPNDNKHPQGVVRIQVLVNDDPSPAGVQILSVSFDGDSIPIKPRDIDGFRGQGSFQKKPGTYKLKWKIQRAQNDWPRTEMKEEKILVDKRDLWLQVTIRGESVTIN